MLQVFTFCHETGQRGDCDCVPAIFVGLEKRRVFVDAILAVLHGTILNEIFKEPGAPAFEFARARSFVVFEGAGFRFTEAPALPPKKTKNVGKRIRIVKFRWDQKSAPFTKNVKRAAPRSSKSYKG